MDESRSPLPPAAKLTPSSPLPPAGGAGGGQDARNSPTFQPRNTARARGLRAQASPAERILWRALSGRKLNGHKFSRQMPVGPYFADFLCREARLVIELDGETHAYQADYDRRRDAFMRAEGFVVLRFLNDDVMTNLDGVLAGIADALTAECPPPTPPAGGRGEEGGASWQALRATDGPHPTPSPEREGLSGAHGLEGSLG